MADIFGFDAYTPKEIAERVETLGVGKARLPLLSQITLGILTGAELFAPTILSAAWWSHWFTISCTAVMAIN